MSTAHSVGGNALLALAIAAVGLGLAAGAGSLLGGLSLTSAPVLSSTPAVVAYPVAGVCGGAVVLPAGVLLAMNS